MNEELLRQYYYDSQYIEGCALFSELADEFKEWLAGTHGFKLFEAKRKLESAKEEIRNELPKN